MNYIKNHPTAIALILVALITILLLFLTDRALKAQFNCYGRNLETCKTWEQK